MWPIALIVLIVGLAMASTGEFPSTEAGPHGKSVNIVPPKNDPQKKSLQLYTFGFSEISPTILPPVVTPPQGSGSYCPKDSEKTATCTQCVPEEQDMVFCKEDPCLGTDPANQKLAGLSGFLPGNLKNKNCVYGPHDPLHDQKGNDPTCVKACIGKPVIYLYPLVDTLVDVLLRIPGQVVVSDPLYPADGWKNVLAHPSGALEYQGKTYRELFYETSVDTINQPATGILIPKESLKEKLTEYTTKLGLVSNEQQEFLEYWLPKLRNLHSPYIYFSILDPIEKERVDHVTIAPKPDTKIEFIAYFKAVTIPYEVKPLQLPEKPPVRRGFTAVEWGGVIDQN